MTVKKAIVIVDWILNNKTKTIKEFYKPGIIDTKSNICQNLYRTLLMIAETDISNLEAVKKQLVPDQASQKNARYLWRSKILHELQYGPLILFLF